MKRIIMPICGGGLRGIIPACALIELERQTGKLTADVIDFVAGTSTGALIAAAVAARVPATKILAIYQNRATDIFRHGGLSLPLQLFRGYSDDSENIKRVLVSEFGAAANWTMNQAVRSQPETAALDKVLICATAMNGHPYFFVPANPRNSGLTALVSLVDAACASAAAPIYFDPFTVDVAGQKLDMYDGGVIGVANPTYQAAIEAFDYDSYNPAVTRIITLGTGFYAAPDSTPSGLLAEIEWVIDTLVDSSTDWVDRAVAKQWPGIATKLNVQLPRPITMADVDAIPDLVMIGKRWAATIDWKALLI